MAQSPDPLHPSPLLKSGLLGHRRPSWVWQALLYGGVAEGRTGVEGTCQLTPEPEAYHTWPTLLEPGLYPVLGPHTDLHCRALGRGLPAHRARPSPGCNITAIL